MRRAPLAHNLHGRLHLGEEEPIFRSLPADVLGNLRHPGSENALLWNLLYPLAQPTILLSQLLSVTPIWGTAALREQDDELLPYFWGVSAAGTQLVGLKETLQAVDGPTGQTEVDLILLGRQHLIVAEVKNRAALGHCVRYSSGRCPEVGALKEAGQLPCRYWEAGESEFAAELEFGPRPCAAEESPPCAGHYQLARTLLVGRALARRLHRHLHLWFILPRANWREYELAWLDFAGRVRQGDLWRRMRVLAWEDLARLPRGQAKAAREAR
jgi:hypothetical protein